MQPDPKLWPNGIESTIDYVHELGLGFGLYGDRGNLGGAPWTIHSAKGLPRLLPAFHLTFNCSAPRLCQEPWQLGPRRGRRQILRQFEDRLVCLVGNVLMAELVVVVPRLHLRLPPHCRRYKSDSCYATSDHQTVREIPMNRELSCRWPACHLATSFAVPARPQHLALHFRPPNTAKGL